MKYFWAALITVWLVAAVYLYANFVLFHRYFGKAGQKKQSSGEKHGFNDTAYERVNITSADELILTAKLFTPENGDGKKSVLLCHGYRSDGETDFQKEFEMYKDLGFNILMIEQRCHGKSAGEITSFGITESYDIVYWCNWLELRFGTGCPTVIHGKEMGAFATMVGLASPELPGNVKKAVVEDAFDSVYEVFSSKIQEKYTFLSKLIIPTVNMFYRNSTGFDMRNADIRNFQKKIKIPVLFISAQGAPRSLKNVGTALSGADPESFVNE